MGTGEGTPKNTANDSYNIEKTLAEYERAQDVGRHADIIIYETAAIVWGANTLLLGFILEVSCDSNNQKLVMVAAVLGLLMSLYVPLVMRLTKKNQGIAYAICREIENDLHLPHRLNNRIHQMYPQWKPGRVAIWVLTAFFVGAWVYVAGQACSCLRRSTPSIAVRAQFGSIHQEHPRMPGELRVGAGARSGGIPGYNTALLTR